MAKEIIGGCDMKDPQEKEVIWRWKYGVYVPFCPYCDEPAYEHEGCVFCGKPYHWVEGEYTPTKASRGEWTVIQSTNNHVTIYHHDHMVMHAQCTEKKTEEQLLAMIESYIRFKQSGAIEDLLAEED